jgi:hypothetical protein
LSVTFLTADGTVTATTVPVGYASEAIVTWLQGYAAAGYGCAVGRSLSGRSCPVTDSGIGGFIQPHCSRDRSYRHRRSVTLTMWHTILRSWH